MRDLEERVKIREEALFRLRLQRSGDADYYESVAEAESPTKKRPFVGKKSGVTLEQLRNLQNPKFLFSKDDHVGLQQLLGLEEEASSPSKGKLGKVSVRGNPDYLDTRSNEYHRKLMNRAQEIEALERKRNSQP